MSKRGQVSVFMVIGIVLVIIVMLIWFLRSELGVGVPAPQFLTKQLVPIKKDVENCVEKVVRPNVELLGLQGGDFDPGAYRLYEGKKVKYWCMNIPGDDRCLNVMPTLEDIVGNLNIVIQEGMRNCVNPDLVKPSWGYNIKVGELGTSTEARGSIILVKINYDVTLIKDEISVPLGEVREEVRDVPVADLYDVGYDITNALAKDGFFEQLFYMLQKKGLYIINVDKPWPDVVYKINKKDSKFELWFAVEGESG